MSRRAVQPEAYLQRIEAGRTPAAAGNKAINLYRLMQIGVRVPLTYVVTWQAYDHYLQDHLPLVQTLQQQLAQALDPQKFYAVRSSANIEDTLEHSFAGQFKTVLGLQGERSILQAIWSIWASASSSTVQAYLKRLPQEQRDLHMAVLVQEMVKPVVSGVSFSRNPLTGADEVIVEAVLGSGDVLVQQGATPLRWVHQAGQWKSAPVQPPVSTSLIEQVVEQTRQIARRVKTLVDLEWVYDGQELHWVQMREITSLKNLTIYSNRIAKEVLPGMIKPLVWSINIPLVNAAWIDLLTELVGKNDLQLDDLARSFYYRTYFNLSALGRIWQILEMPQESLEILMGIQPRPEDGRMFKPSWHMLRLAPRLLIFFANKWRLGGRFEREYPFLVARFQSYHWQEALLLNENELLAEINRLYADLRPLVYYNINIPLLMALYNSLFERYLKRVGVDPARFNLMDGMVEHLDYAPEHSLKNLQQAFASLEPPVQEFIHKASYEEFTRLPGIPDFQAQISEFLTRFGHLSDSGNDFSVVPWREKPEVALQLAAQSPAAGEAGVIQRFDDLHFSAFHRPWVRLSFARARRFRLYREQISSLYTYAYGLFRPYFLALGQRFKERGLLAEPADIFYLNRDEIQHLAYPGEPGVGPLPARLEHPAALVRVRKEEMENCRDVLLPTLIYGEAAPLTLIGEVEKLTGVPTSRGYYTGPARVVGGLDDFPKVQNGDVLVIPFSDVGWSPLFARAGAIIAESGGMLSHSSIVAREYHIPAVVSVTGAMRLLDGCLVTVDGFRGEIILHTPER